jgi:hypothetical protein
MKNQNFFNQRKQETDIIGRLSGLNFIQVELVGITMGAQMEVIEAVEDFYKDFPIMKKLTVTIQVVNSMVLSGKMAMSKILVLNGKLMGTILINYDEFTNSGFKEKLRLLKQCELIVSDNIRGLIIHELTHLLHYLFDIIFCDVNIQNIVSEEKLQLLEHRIKSFETTNKIKNQALKRAKIPDAFLANHLSIYAKATPNEFIAEALAEYYSSIRPRLIAQNVYQLMKQYSDMIACKN